MKFIGSLTCLFSSVLFVIKEHPFERDLYLILVLVAFSLFMLFTEKSNKGRKRSLFSMYLKCTSIVYLSCVLYGFVKTMI